MNNLEQEEFVGTELWGLWSYEKEDKHLVSWGVSYHNILPRKDLTENGEIEGKGIDDLGLFTFKGEISKGGTIIQFGKNYSGVGRLGSLNDIEYNGELNQYYFLGTWEGKTPADELKKGGFILLPDERIKDILSGTSKHSNDSLFGRTLISYKIRELKQEIEADRNQFPYAPRV